MTTYGPVGVAHRWRLAIGVVAALNAVTSLAGSAGLITGWLTLGELTERLPFGSTLLAGTALAVLVCAPNALLTRLAFRRSSTTAAASVVVGSMMVGWILLEVAFLHVFAGLQVVYMVVGLVQVGLGFLLGWHDPGLPPRALAGTVWLHLTDSPRHASHGAGWPTR